MATHKKLTLREVNESDLSIFFNQQLDEESNYMAAFISRDPKDKNAFTAHWNKILTDDSVVIQTILLDDDIIGNIASFIMFGEREVSYWIGKEYWGNGFATMALSEFLIKDKERPLHAHAAKDNIASIRVLEKCGFKIIDEDKGFSNIRKMDVEEFILKLV